MAEPGEAVGVIAAQSMGHAAEVEKNTDANSPSRRIMIEIGQRIVIEVDVWYGSMCQFIYWYIPCASWLVFLKKRLR